MPKTGQKSAFGGIGSRYFLTFFKGFLKIISDIGHGGHAVEETAIFEMMVKASIIKINGTAGRDVIID